MRVIYHQMRKNNNAFCAMREERKAAREDARPPVPVISLRNAEVSVYCKNLETRTALCAGRGTAFAYHPAVALLLKKRRRTEYRLPPHSQIFRQTCGFEGNKRSTLSFQRLPKRGRRPALPLAVCACRRGGARRAHAQCRFRRTRRHASQPRSQMLRTTARSCE